MRFEDRAEAGGRLAEALCERAEKDVVVLAIPRGGVMVGAVVASAMGAPLDVVVPRKVGAPGNPELGIGALAPGVRVLDEEMIRGLGVPQKYLDAEIEAQEREMARRVEAYRGDRPAVELEGKTAVVVDDGVATGSTAIASLRWARARGASRVVLAVPVAPVSSIERLLREADDVVVLATPEPFFAVGQWYRKFDQVEDEEVVAALAGAAGGKA